MSISFKNRLKYLVRSRSLEFVAAMDRSGPIEAREFRFGGRPIYYRSGTSDPHLIYGILLKKGKKAEYRFPDRFRPRVILDIGANIGVTSVLFAHQFGGTKIHAIEPVPSNFELLRRNASGWPGITSHALALADHDGSMNLIVSPDERNHGGYSFYQRGASADAVRVTVPAVTPGRFLAANGVDRVDLIKIDTEGAEYPILASFDPAVLAETTWITGELHGENDFELLAYLSRWFDIELKKSFRKPLFIFRACNKKTLDLV